MTTLQDFCDLFEHDDIIIVCTERFEGYTEGEYLLSMFQPQNFQEVTHAGRVEKTSDAIWFLYDADGTVLIQQANYAQARSFVEKTLKMLASSYRTLKEAMDKLKVPYEKDMARARQYAQALMRVAVENELPTNYEHGDDRVYYVPEGERVSYDRSTIEQHIETLAILLGLPVEELLTRLEDISVRKVTSRKASVTFTSAKKK